MLLTCLLASNFVFADSHDLTDILNSARQNDSSYHSKQLGFQAERISSQVKMRSLYPKVDLAIKGDLASKSGSPVVTIATPVFDVSKILDQRIGQVDYDMSELSQAEYEQAYRKNVAKAYFEVLSQNALLKTQATEYQRLKKSYAQAQEMSNADLQSDIDVLAAKANLDLSSVEVLEASTNLRHAKGSLKKMINQPITKLKGLEPDLVSRLTISDSQTVFATAQLKNIDYLKKQQALKKAHVELNKAQGKFYPTVSLSITAKQDLNADIFDMDNKTSGGSLSTSINIYNGGKDVLDTEQKTLKSFAAEDDLSNLLYDLGVNSSKVVADFENAQARRLASKAAEDSSLKKLNAMHEKHLMGQASELELYSAITQASKAQKDHINASHQVILKYIDVAILMGELDDSHILQINQLLGADIEFESIADLSSASDLATMILSPKNPG